MVLVDGATLVTDQRNFLFTSTVHEIIAVACHEYSCKQHPFAPHAVMAEMRR